jgi:excisionase family DNA binding protein
MSTTPLFVRLASADAELLDRAAASSGQTKRQLVGSALREHLSAPEGDGGGGLVVGRVALRELAPEVLTLAEAAVLLRVAEQELAQAAASRSLPARRIGEQWRFSHDALLAWLGGAGEERRASD